MQPLCLVEPSLRVNPEALDRLRCITDPLHVVGIFGPKNTGKSFLMDQLAEQNAGFGSTPGIWMQLLPHPAKPGEVLVLLDTKGFLEQTDKGEEEALCKLFCLEALLCSVLIYNTRVYGELQDELGGLLDMRQMKELARTKLAVIQHFCYMKQLAVLKQMSLENSSLLSSILPEFVWCFRDVASNLTWEEILQATDNDLDILLPVCLDLLHPTFRKQLGAFKQYILSKGPKRNANGGILCRWLEQLVNALSRNQPIPLSTILKGSEAPVASVLGSWCSVYLSAIFS
ncbi:Guanylate-binding protein 1 [Varanus komodoensis]|nr:Guanylate-binding protein 1 [Varanus komodoensis]